MSHHCHEVEVPPRLWGCRRHWYMVPPVIRKQIWTHYRPGQEIDKAPSAAYLYWFARAQMAVAEREGKSHLPDYQWAKRQVEEHEAKMRERANA